MAPTIRTKTRGACVLLEDEVRIPLVRNLEEFRRWARSDDFPERGRIDYLGGDLEIDMSPEDLGTHGDPKAEIAIELGNEVKRRDLGRLWIDCARISNVAADLSCEPDVLFCSWETLESRRAKLIPKASRKAGRWIELEGSPDLVVEVVSDSSVSKDTERLRERYHEAGVREYWIADARGGELAFSVLAREPHGFVTAKPDTHGFARSRVLDRSVRFTRSPARLGFFRYELAIVEKRARRGRRA